MLCSPILRTAESLSSERREEHAPFPACFVTFCVVPCESTLWQSHENTQLPWLFLLLVFTSVTELLSGVLQVCVSLMEALLSLITPFNCIIPPVSPESPLNLSPVRAAKLFFHNEYESVILSLRML